MPIRITQALIDEMVAHARDDVPNECCGMLGGTDGTIATVHRVPSKDPSPFRFEITGKPLFDALNAIDEDGQELLGIYHSHTKSTAQPSQTDINMAASWPDPAWVIISLEDPEAPVVNAFWIRDGKVTDAELDIV